jgi:hypothetical protein
LLAACGGDGGAQAAPIGREEDSGTPTVTPKDAGAADAKADAASVSNPNGPVLSVVTPTPTDDPSSSDVISASAISVRCEVRKNPKGEIVDPTSVKVSIYQGEMTKAVLTQKATATGEADLYEAQNINLSDVAHGTIRIECEAADLGSKVERSMQSITTLLDKGPAIAFLSPMEKGYVSAARKLGSQGIDVSIRFRVSPQPLGEDDPGAAVTEVKAMVAGKQVPKIEPSTVEKDVYTFSLNFEDKTFFTVIPPSLSIRIEATNARSMPRVSSAVLNVGVDAVGPVITVKQPLGSGGGLPVVSGKVDVILTVSDALAGVKNDSVEVRIATDVPNMPVTYIASQISPGTYAASFETGRFPNRAILNISLAATDQVGIETITSMNVDVDSVPPWISLDPPNVREYYPKAQAGPQCTGSFDPLGALDPSGSYMGMVNDLDVIAKAFRPAALLWDRPLSIPNVVSTVALIDVTTPKFYIQHNTSVPLLIDSDQDANHECDRINTSTEDTSKAPAALVLSALAPVGVAYPAGNWVAPNSFVEDLTTAPSVEGLCHTTPPGVYPGQAPLAVDTVLRRIIRHTVQGGAPVVFVNNPAASGLRSTGLDYQGAQPGWACLAATAKDRAGNSAFSPPLRVCFKFDGETCTSPPPTCTDGCVIPALFSATAEGRMNTVLTY